MAIEYPKISVVTAVRNSVNTLERAIKSLQEQNYPNLEYIVLDAESTDGTLEIIKKYENFISQFRSKKDGGANFAYNEGIDRATGEVVAFLNADDWYEPGILKRIGEEFATNPAADMVTCQARVMKKDKNGNLIETKRFEGDKLKLNFGGSPIPNVRFTKKKIYEKYGKFITSDDKGNYFVAADLEILMRFALKGVRSKTLNVLGYTYLEHADSLTFGKNSEMKKRLYREHVFIAEKFLNCGEKIPRQGIKRLRRWHRRGTARMFMWNFMSGKISDAVKEMIRGVNVSPFLWMPYTIRYCLTGVFKGYSD